MPVSEPIECRDEHLLHRDLRRTSERAVDDRIPEGLPFLLLAGPNDRVGGGEHGVHKGRIVLQRFGLVKRHRRRRGADAAIALSRPAEPNALWCADYKGEFMLRNRRYCYPLTMSDFATRYLLVCEALPTTQASFAFTVFERAFNDFGLPRMIRTDNGLSQKSRAQSFAELACCQI